MAKTAHKAWIAHRIGCAIVLCVCVACGGGERAERVRENIITMRSDTLTVVQSDNGKPSNRFYTPVMEEYAFAPEPYREFPRGIDVITYDSLGGVESTLRANYALQWLALDRWDLKGDVVGTNRDGDMVETQQLNWSAKTEKVWSNVQTRLTRQDGNSATGEGFEADQDFSRWRFRKGTGTQTINTEPNRETAADSTAMEGASLVAPTDAPASAPVPPAPPVAPVDDRMDASVPPTSPVIH